MASLNETKEDKSERTKTENFEGGEAFEPEDARMQLYQLTINNLVEDQFYLDADESLDELKQVFGTVAREDPEFIAKLAAHAREDKGLRTIPQVLVVLGAEYPEVRKHFRDFATEIIQRADELCEVVAGYNQIHGREATSRMPNDIRVTLEKALKQQNEYTIAKYDRPQRSVRPVDVVNLISPTPDNKEQEQLFDKITKGEKNDYPEIDSLETPDTWETYLTGRVEELRNSYEGEEDVPEEELKEVKKNAFEDLLEDNKMNMFAKIRNLRNMLEVGVNPEKVLDNEDLEYVRNGDHKLYPFRFYQAYKALKQAEADYDSPIDDLTYLEDWLSEAVDATSDNLPDKLGNTFVAVDVSGSMDTPLSTNSQMTYKEIGMLFGASLYGKGARVTSFASEVYGNPDVEGSKELNAHRGTPTFEVMDKLDASIGEGTYGYKVPEYLHENDVDVDRLVIFTDQQLYTEGRGYGNSESFKDWVEKIRKDVNPEMSVFIFDLSSYPDLAMPEGMEKVFQMKGWDSDMLDFLLSAEKPGQAIEEISNREPPVQ